MSLYIRVANSFWTHRKTMRLRARIGDAAFWIPPRLWSYAADSQPDGCFHDYSAEELALLLAYSGDAQALLQALLQAGFLDDGMTIHDWCEHNGYHDSFAARARKAAAARWKGKDKKGKDKKGKEASIASSNAQACEVYDLYPRKVGKRDAIKAIESALKRASFETLKAKVSEFKAATDQWVVHERQFIPHPASWFNADRWLDDPSEWKRIPPQQHNGKPRELSIAEKIIRDA